MKFASKTLIIMLMLGILLWAAACGEAVSDEVPEADAPVVSQDDAVQEYVEVSREGQIEQIPVEIAHGMAGDYTIAYAPEYFVYYPSEYADTFSCDGWEQEQRVYYSVYTNHDFSSQQLVDGLILQNGGNYDECRTEQLMLGGYDATAVYFDSYSAEIYPMHFFVIESSDGCYVIEAQFSVEMYEGLYAIMRACFDTFTMVG